MINANRKWLKAFLALRVKKIGFPIAPIFGICIEFLNFLFLDKFTTILLALSLTSTILLSSNLNTFRAKSNDPIIFNNKVNNTAILLKPWIKRQ